MKISRIVILSAASLCLLSACAGNKQATHYYLLKPLQAESVPHQPAIDGKVIGIGPITLPKYLDRPQLTTYTGDYTVRISEFHQWAEPLQDNFSRVLIENLSIMLPGSRFERYPWKRSIKTSHQIAITVDRFDLNPNTALLSAHWIIETEQDKKQKNHSARIEKSLPDAGYETKISVLSKLLELLGAEITKSITE